MQNNTPYLSRDLSREVGFLKNHGTNSHQKALSCSPSGRKTFGDDEATFFLWGVLVEDSHQCWRF